MKDSGDYISREAANEACREAVRRYPSSFYNGIEAARDAIRKLPAADVRPVVLCRDCVHFQQFRPHDGFCKIDGMLWNNDFFCANGKRERKAE